MLCLLKGNEGLFPIVPTAISEITSTHSSMSFGESSFPFSTSSALVAQKGFLATAPRAIFTFWIFVVFSSVSNKQAILI